MKYTRPYVRMITYVKRGDKKILERMCSFDYKTLK